VAISSFVVYSFVANLWRNSSSQFVFLLANVAKATAGVANDGEIASPAKNGGNTAKSQSEAFPGWLQILGSLSGAIGPSGQINRERRGVRGIALRERQSLPPI
jgi:hypothetical protein